MVLHQITEPSTQAGRAAVKNKIAKGKEKSSKKWKSIYFLAFSKNIFRRLTSGKIFEQAREKNKEGIIPTDDFKKVQEITSKFFFQMVVLVPSDSWRIISMKIPN